MSSARNNYFDRNDPTESLGTFDNDGIRRKNSVHVIEQNKMNLYNVYVNNKINNIIP